MINIQCDVFKTAGYAYLTAFEFTEEFEIRKKKPEN